MKFNETPAIMINVKFIFLHLNFSAFVSLITNDRLFKNFIFHMPLYLTSLNCLECPRKSFPLEAKTLGFSVCKSTNYHTSHPCYVRDHTVALNNFMTNETSPKIWCHFLGSDYVPFQNLWKLKFFTGSFPRSEPQDSEKATRNYPRGVKPQKMDSPYPKTYT